MSAPQRILRASATSIAPNERTEGLSLPYWMGRVRKELERVCSSADADSVHDLRVAIRRCRSLATVLQEADPTPGWGQLRKVPRKLFRELGAWRDAQVLKEWVRRLAPEGDVARARLLEILEGREREAQAAALRATEKFDASRWKRLERTLRRRARLVPQDGLTAQCLALERLEATQHLHERALRSEKPKPWHALRIGLKRFRYTAENLLPQAYAGWEGGLKRVQDLLGEVHDLDVLADLLRSEEPNLPAESAEAFRSRLAGERAERLQTYRQLTLGRRTGLWHVWRSGLPQGARLESAALARLRTTARALDPKPRRTARIYRLALRLFDALAAAGIAPLARDAAARGLLRAAARLHGIGGSQERKPGHKAARAILQKLPAPPGWSCVEWELLAETVRYHRGAEPKPGHRGFAALSEEKQRLVRTLAGILRLARALRRCGVESAPGLRAQPSVDAIVLRVPGWFGSAANTARVGAGKHLLEVALERPLLLEAVEKVVVIAAETQNEPPGMAAASD